MKFIRGSYILERSDWNVGDDVEVIPNPIFPIYMGYIFPRKAVVVSVEDNIVTVEIHRYTSDLKKIDKYEVEVSLDRGVPIDITNTEFSIYPMDMYGKIKILNRERLRVLNEVSYMSESISVEGLNKILEIINEDLTTVHNC